MGRGPGAAPLGVLPPRPGGWTSDSPETAAIRPHEKGLEDEDGNADEGGAAALFALGVAVAVVVAAPVGPEGEEVALHIESELPGRVPGTDTGLGA